MHVIDVYSPTWLAIKAHCEAQMISIHQGVLDSSNNFEEVLRLRGKAEEVQAILALPDLQKRLLDTALEVVPSAGF